MLQEDVRKEEKNLARKILRMLSKKNRLSKKKDFDAVFKQGRGVSGKFLFLKKRENSQAESRIGLVAPAKHFKGAVLRNKIKRRLREQTRNRLSQTKKGYDIVIVAKPGLENIDSQQAGKEVERILKRAGLYPVDGE